MLAGTAPSLFAPGTGLNAAPRTLSYQGHGGRGSGVDGGAAIISRISLYNCGQN
ncbi:hypothetical protein SAMN04489710_107233 [Paracidovorax konjaci]|uniref:Uncharacterized protein n=1 Tax=Paracidovorax konjaci TaxID=32040 RepID=A0A1I1VVT1_9BURK|nr:hypothetical protein SAMN04489710_107233 [Paracidovorax konjaci]